MYVELQNLGGTWASTLVNLGGGGKESLILIIIIIIYYLQQFFYDVSKIISDLVIVHVHT